MKLNKLKKLIAIVIVCLLLLTCAGCNYIKRPDGAKNNSTDNSNRLLQLLVKDQFVPEEEPEEEPEDEPEDEPEEEPEDEPEDEPEEEPEVPETPFNAPGDVLSKISGLLNSLAEQQVDATSATGVKDELMASRTVTVALPYELFDNQDEIIANIASKLNMNIEVQIISQDYLETMRRNVLGAKKIDLMYVDQSAWGYSQHITQELSQFVNFKVGDKLGTFSSTLSNKFVVGSDDDKQLYVASGISSPYLLVYNKNNIVVPNTKITGDTYTSEKEKQSEDYVAEEYSDIEVKDPVTMYQNGSWGISAFTEILKASTTAGRVGLVSFLNDDRNLDIWFGMQDNAGFSIDTVAHNPLVDTSLVDDEGLDTVGGHIDTVQSLYWSVTGKDRSNYVANFVDIGHGDGNANQTKWLDTLKKVAGTYKGNDFVTNYSFMAIDISEYQAVMEYAEQNDIDLEVVPMPYGVEVEKAVRYGEADEDGYYYSPNGNTMQTYVASSVGGFSVTKTCENPSVALRVAEEITVAWQEQVEDKATSKMDNDVKALYESAKAVPGVSFFRSIYRNTASEYHKTNGVEISDRLSPKQQTMYQTFLTFSEYPESLVQPLYNKNTPKGAYSPVLYKSWSEFMYGKQSENDENSTISSTILPIISMAYLPPSMLFVE